MFFLYSESYESTSDNDNNGIHTNDDIVDTNENDDDEDSITQHMPEEMRQRIKSKRKRKIDQNSVLYQAGFTKVLL